MNETGQYKKKKELFWFLWSISMIVILGLTTSGCSKTPKTSTTIITSVTASTVAIKTETTSATVIAVITTEETVSAPADAVTEETASASADAVTEESISDYPFVRMDNALNDLDIYYEQKWMYAKAIGAAEGQKYSTINGTFEIYLYDMDSEAYKSAVNNNAMDLNGTLFPATVRDGYAIYYYDNVPENIRSDIEAIFFE